MNKIWKKRKKKKKRKWKLLEIVWAAQKSHLDGSGMGWGGGLAMDNQMDRQHRRVTSRVTPCCWQTERKRKLGLLPVHGVVGGGGHLWGFFSQRGVASQRCGWHVSRGDILGGWQVSGGWHPWEGDMSVRVTSQRGVTSQWQGTSQRGWHSWRLKLGADQSRVTSQLGDKVRGWYVRGGWHLWEDIHAGWHPCCDMFMGGDKVRWGDMSVGR